tara:strand:+ start:1821 stop:2762 length:942 start_codon:yes stop_codon:yes gene_type:complete
LLFKNRYTEVTQSGAFLKVPQGRYLQVEFVLSKANLDDFGPTLFNARAKFERALQGGKAAADTSSPLLSWCASCPADAVMSPDLYATSHFPDAIAADFGGSYAPSNDDLLPVSFFTDASSPAARVGKQTITSTVRGSHWLRSKVLNATIIEPACDDKVAFLDASLRLVSAVNGDAGPFTYEWTHVHSGTVLSTVAEQFYPSSSDKLWQGTAGLSGGALFTPGEHSVQLKVRDSIGQEVIATTSFKVRTHFSFLVADHTVTFRNLIHFTSNQLIISIDYIGDISELTLHYRWRLRYDRCTRILRWDHNEEMLQD